MANIKATVIGEKNGDVTLSASRKGSCQSCAQNKHCAIVWHNDPADKTLLLPNEAQSFNKGDIVDLNCDERTLLRYITLLFFPTLVMLLLSTFIAERLFGGSATPQQILLQLAFAFITGVLISRALLRNYARNVLIPTLTSTADLRVKTSPD